MIECRHFSEFFEAIHHSAPFPWQEGLAHKVVREGWPSALDIPTGAGKTAAIDVAVFHLAVEACANKKDRAAEWTAPRRIFFIVDRRLVVDDAHSRAFAIASALNSATSGILKDVADALRKLQGPVGGGESVLRVGRLRGGAPRDPDWLRTPGQAAVIVSTVDQVGSRLLFRGYGVRDTMKSVHAGLVGADALYLIDEAHLSTPFVETVKTIFAAGTNPRKRPPVFQAPEFVAPLRVVTLSATHGKSRSDEPKGQALPGKPAEAADTPFSLSSEDWEHPVLGRRLRASKAAELVSSAAESDSMAFANELAQRAWEQSVFGGGPAAVTCVVVNRVRRARQVFQDLQRRVADGGEAHEDDSPCVALLTGRTRPLARDELLAGLLARMRAPKDGEQRRPLLIAATQCVEAGADLDFDALVTEIAPLDCLRQRFGRLNRIGRDIAVRATICAASDQVGPRAQSDPVYERAAAETWRWIQGKSKKSKAGTSTLDFGVEAANAWLPPPSDRGPYLAPSRAELVLLPTFTEQLSRTAPVPPDDPDVALFLHGSEASPPDVQVVWRADLDYSSADDADLERDWKTRVAACPPSSLEILSIPYSEAVRWLAGEARADIADVEGGTENEVFSNFVRDRVLRWCGRDDPRTRLLRTGKAQRPADQTAGSVVRDRLGPGDTIVVPANRGGCDEWGWNPMSRAPVEDLGAKANERHRRRRILRLSAALLRLEIFDDDEARKKVKALETFVEDSRDWSDREARDRIASLPVELGPAWFEGRPDNDRAVEVIRGNVGSLKNAVVALAYDLERGESLDGELSSGASVIRSFDAEQGGAGEAVTEDDQSVCGTRNPIGLREHSKGVREFALAFAGSVGLNRQLVNDIALAAFLHDAGKAHPEFKAWLYGGDPFHSDLPPLAKSGRQRLPRKARSLANLPDGARHEVASLLFAVQHPAFQDAHDSDLVLWLIGTHHGYGRPFFTNVDWPRAGQSFSVDLGDGTVTSREAPAFADLQSAWFDLRVRVQGRYGPWGVARLEAILRLADHRRSEWEQRTESGEEAP
ncbi:MAG TPA: type I-U CRISPR-associated helicase/endonuclease Cas3 [Polyangiaceae bacterium]|nr:type I-U CRISPR-associated helicase/endonuclease Cas3 [Polyangiaceae bacterium]